MRRAALVAARMYVAVPGHCPWWRPAGGVLRRPEEKKERIQDARPRGLHFLSDSISSPRRLVELIVGDLVININNLSFIKDPGNKSQQPLSSRGSTAETECQTSPHAQTKIWGRGAGSAETAGLACMYTVRRRSLQPLFSNTHDCLSFSDLSSPVPTK